MDINQETNHWKILLVEDDEDDFVMANVLLSDSRPGAFNLHWINEVDEALQVLNSEPWDVILVDFDLGARNGLQFIEEAIQQGCTTPIILLTGHGNYEVDLEAMRLGALDYLSKNEVTPALLERSIRYAIERKNAEELLRQAQEELERRVHERTEELRQANQQLGLANELLEKTFSSIHLLVAHLDRDFNFLRVNQAYALANGHDSQFFSGKNHFALYPNTENEALFRNVVQSGASYYAFARPFENPEQPERAVTFWDWSLQPVKEVDGSISGVVLSLIDVTDRKRTEQALHESEERLKAVVSNAPLILWAIDRQGMIILSEGKGLEVEELYPGELVGRNLFELIASQPEVYDCITRAMAGEEVVAVSPGTFQDEAVFEVHYVPHYNDRKEIIGVIGVSTLITERVLAEKKLAYQAYLLENINDAVVATDENNIVNAWNRAAEQIYGWTADEALGRPVSQLLKSDVKDSELERARHRLLETGQYHAEVIHHDKNGDPVFIENKMIALFDASGKASGYVSVISDIHNRKQAETQIRQNNLRNEALAELSQVLAEAGPDLSKVLETIARRIAELTGDACVLTLLSEDGQLLTPVAYHHPDPEAVQLIENLLQLDPSPPDAGWAGKVLVSGQPILLPEIMIEQSSRPEFQPFVEQYGLHSLLIVPVRAQGQIIGTLGLSRGEPGRPYTLEDQTFLQDLADRAGLAISNARLFQSVQSELQERQRAEEALRESEARFRTIFTNAATGIELRDLQGRLLAGNPALQQMLGLGEGLLLDINLFELTHPAELAVEEPLFKSLVIGATERYQIEKRYHQPAGDWIWVRSTVSLVRNQQNEPQFVIAMVENINRRKKMEAELAEVQRRLIDSREAERLYLAQEIHDGPMQDLYGISFQMKGLQDELVDEKLRGQAGIMQTQLTEVIHVLREISGELRPPTLTPFGLERSIRSHAERFEKEYPHIRLHLHLARDGQILPESVRVALFRIYQQALANAARHAEANNLQVIFELDAEQARLEVQDDGCGFQVPERWYDFVLHGHLGLAGISERAQAIGGKLLVESQVGQGTSIEVVVPLEVVPDS